MKHSDYLKKKKARETRKKIISVIAAFVVFVTTYALVLPAITLDVSRANKEPGIAFEQMQFKASASAAAVTAAENTDEEAAVEVKAEETQVEETKEEASEKEEAPAEEPAPAKETEESKEEASAEAAPAEEAEKTEETVEEAPAETVEEEAPAEDKADTNADQSAVKQEDEPVESAQKEENKEAASNDASASNSAESNDVAAVDQTSTGTAETAESAAAATTEAATEFQIPEKDPLDFDEILTGKTDFYFYHVENAEEAENFSSDSVDDWKKVNSDTVLAPEDFVRVYLSYEIPAGALNETNPVARYTLPKGLELSDKQIEAINKYENGVAAAKSGSEHDKYLGAEAIEGDRTPDEKAGDENISATVKVDKVHKDGEDRQELVFTFIPYTVEKNQTGYDEVGEVISEGKKVKGFFTFDLTTSQIDFEKTNIETVENEDGTTEEIQYSEAEVVFVKENNDKDIEEISRTLILADAVEKTEETKEQKNLKYEGADYTVTVTYTDDAEIPENSELKVREIDKEQDAEEYASYLEQAQAAVEQSKAVNEARFFDITIYAGEEKIEPKAPVSVQINFTGIEQTNTDDTQLLHYKDDKEVEVMDKAEFSKSEETNQTAEEVKPVDTVQFEAEGFSVYGIVGTETIEKEITITSPDGEDVTYVVSVIYGKDAEIPEGAYLDVTEYAEESEEFQNAWRTVTGTEYFSEENLDDESQTDENAEAADEISDQLHMVQRIISTPAGMAVLDISIFDENDNVVEPKAPVTVSITMKELPEDVEDDVLSSTLAVQHLNENTGEMIVETVASTNDSTIGEVEVQDSVAKAEFIVDSFSTFTITWGSATNTTTNLRLRENNNNRAQITVYYVDQDGNAITRPSTIGINTDTTISWSNNSYTYNISDSNLARAITGYTYVDAHSDSYDGTAITSVTLTRSGSGMWRTYSTDVSSIYLVYSGTPTGITVHYGYMSGGEFVEFGTDEDGEVPAGTTLTGPTQIGDQIDLEYEISGYHYVTSYLTKGATTNPTTGTQISALLNTDAPSGRTNFDNNSSGGYTSSTSSGTLRWRYRQLSSLSWNPTGDSWTTGGTDYVSGAVTGYGVTKHVAFADDDTDIYVVYEAGSLNAGSGSSGGSDMGDLSAPATDKNVDSNGDGTYDVTLSVTGQSKSQTEKTKANVIVVLDTSWSMYGNDAGSGQSRMAVAKTAINSLADKLFALNADESDTVELAFITFAQRVRNELEMQTIYSGTNASAFKSMINGLDCASGTNWDDALYAANHIDFGDDDPTYVVFVTDGGTISMGHPVNGAYSEWDGGTYTGAGEGAANYVAAASIQANNLLNAGKKLYKIGAFGNITTLSTGIPGTYLGRADDLDTINGYFDDIINEIQNALGYEDVTINDGITALTSVDLVNGDVTSFKYYRSGGTSEDGTTPKYSTTDNDGRGEEWTDIPDSAKAYYLEVKSVEGTTKYYKNGTDVSFSDLGTDLTESEFLVKYPVGTKTVIWNIDLGKDENDVPILLEDGVTYTIAFTVWPSQEAYDLVAELNNGIKVYAEGSDNSITAAERDQIVELTAPTESTPGTYALKTNTSATVDYTAVHMENGEPVGEPTTGTATIKDPNGQMTLDTEKMTVRKAFSHAINSQDPYAELTLYVMRDGEYYLQNGNTTTVKPGSEGSDSYSYYSIHLPKESLPTDPTDEQVAAYWDESNWSGSIYIAPGLMKGGSVLETGHNYSLYEVVDDGKTYEYEFTTQTLRPMNISSTEATYLILEDDFNTPSSSSSIYTIDNSTDPGTYVTGRGDSGEVYYSDKANSSELVGTNRKTAELDITKIIKDDTGEMTTAQKNAETFTYKVTLTVPSSADTSGITAYEYVARYNDEPASNRYTIFGYRTSDETAGTAGIDTDYSRFKDKIYGSYTVTSPDHPASDYTMNCMFETDAGGTTKTAVIYITLKQQEIIRFTNLPSGTEYTIEEVYANYRQADPSRNADATEAANTGIDYTGYTPAQQGYTVTSTYKNGSRSESGGSVIKGKVETTDLDKRLYNQFTNTRTSTTNDVRAELKVTKVVDGYTWGSEYYRMNLTAGEATYSDETGGTGTSPMPNHGSDNLNIYDSTSDHTLSFGEVLYSRPGTYKYVVTEYDNSSRMPEVVFAKPVTVTVTVAADESTGKLYIAGVADDSGVENNSVLTAATDITLDTVTTTMTNTTREIHLEKVDSTNNTTLEGAKFSLIRGSEKQYISGDSRILTAEQYAALTDEAQADCKTVFELGTADLKGFELDTVYELKETDSPKGYIIASGSTYFKVSKNASGTYVIRLTDKDGTPLVDEDSNPVLETTGAKVTGDSLTLVIKNTPGQALPNTGGPGTLLYTLGGLILIMGAAMMYGFRMRRRERRLN